jgi:hypothetical protein
MRKLELLSSRTSDLQVFRQTLLSSIGGALIRVPPWPDSVHFPSVSCRLVVQLGLFLQGGTMDLCPMQQRQ